MSAMGLRKRLHFLTNSWGNSPARADALDGGLGGDAKAKGEVGASEFDEAVRGDTAICESPPAYGTKC